MPEDTIRNLIHRLRNGDEATRAAAQLELVERYRGPICRHIRLELVARGLGGRPTSPDMDFDSAVDSVFHELLLRFLRRVAKRPFNQEDAMNLVQYLKKMASHQLHDRARRAQRRSSQGMRVEDMADSLSSREPAPDEVLEENEETAQRKCVVAKLLRSLDGKDQELMRDLVQGTPLPTIAQKMGESPARCRARKSRCIQRLKGRSREGGGGHV